MRSHIKTVIGLILFTILGRPVLVTSEPEFGTVKLPEGMTVKIQSELVGTDNSVVLPQGGYKLIQWNIHRTDRQGIPWTCTGYVPNDNSFLEVVKDHQTELPVGEPFVSVLTATLRGSDFVFRHRLEGRLGEKVSIYKDGQRSPEPRLQIKNANGSYQQTLTFRTYNSSGGGGMFGGG
ncbi:hypothetical protein ACFL3Q_05230 [Planctomycetota bacterium]